MHRHLLRQASMQACGAEDPERCRWAVRRAAPDHGDAGCVHRHQNHGLLSVGGGLQEDDHVTINDCARWHGGLVSKGQAPCAQPDLSRQQAYPGCRRARSQQRLAGGALAPPADLSSP
jgi:hypothetical protein